MVWKDEMIQLTAEKLMITDSDGTPLELDMGLLEKSLADSFRRLGFKDDWMAEDVSTTVEEKIRGTDATLLSRPEVDSLIVSILNAAGFPDVAKDYSRNCAGDPFEDARKSMAPWQERLHLVLRRTLPLTPLQVEQVAALCRKVLEASGVTMASDRFMTDLAIHLLVNHSERTLNAAPKTAQLTTPTASGEAQHAAENAEAEPVHSLVSDNVVRVWPVTSVFSWVRISIRMGTLVNQFASGWLSPMTLCSGFERLAPQLLQLLDEQRQKLSAQNPLQAESPAHVIIPDFQEYLALDPRMWKRKSREEMERLMMQLFEEHVRRKATFGVVLTLK